jgi:signal recognition particle receptor subunit beta
MRERCGLRKKKKTTKMESKLIETMKWTFKKHMFLFPGQKKLPESYLFKVSYLNPSPHLIS